MEMKRRKKIREKLITKFTDISKVIPEVYSSETIFNFFEEKDKRFSILGGLSKFYSFLKSQLEQKKFNIIKEKDEESITLTFLLKYSKKN